MAANTKVIFLTTPTTGVLTWAVPSDWNPNNNSVELIAAGAQGGPGTGARPTNRVGHGASGGAYVKGTNLSLTINSNAYYHMDVADVVNGTTFFGSSLAAGAPLIAANGVHGGNAAPATASRGSIVHIGGDGSATGGGGGAGGPNGAGLPGVGAAGGAGDNGFGGAGGTAGSTGQNGLEYTTTLSTVALGSSRAGSGGGGGAPPGFGNGSDAGRYGGGGGAGNGNVNNSGNGGPAIIIITYTPGPRSFGLIVS